MKVKRPGETEDQDKAWATNPNPLRVGYKNPNSIEVKIVLEDDFLKPRYTFRKRLNPSGISSRMETELTKAIKVFCDLGIVDGNRAGFSLTFSGNQQDYDRYLRLMKKKGWECCPPPSSPKKVKHGKALVEVDAEFVVYNEGVYGRTKQVLAFDVLSKEVRNSEIPNALAQSQAIYWSLDKYQDCTLAFCFEMSSNVDDPREGMKDFARTIMALEKLGWETPDTPRLTIVPR